MNTETATQTPFPTSAENAPSMGGNGSEKSLHQYAQRIHEAVDTLEQRLNNSTERVLSMQEEYGEMAREEVRAHPLAAVGVAFAAGFILAKLLR
ncbi:MAG: hypothetical protein HY854_10025 [Burkholderiales bacterium]|nr:hypothetical protein [Burkholderiales bacterium]